jgi:hypothetical protein
MWGNRKSGFILFSARCRTAALLAVVKSLLTNLRREAEKVRK